MTLKGKGLVYLATLLEAYDKSETPEFIEMSAAVGTCITESEELLGRYKRLEAYLSQSGRDEERKLLADAKPQRAYILGWMLGVLTGMYLLGKDAFK